jgi:hypothetical protein
VDNPLFSSKAEKIWRLLISTRIEYTGQIGKLFRLKLAVSRIKHIVEHFVFGVDATRTAQLVHLNRKKVNRCTVAELQLPSVERYPI